MLEILDLTRSLTKQEFRAVVGPLEIRLGELQRTLRAERVPTLLLFEGWDAAGKGTCMSALIQPLDPRGYRVYADHRPTEEELLRPFLWRFWKRLPPGGDIALFDRGWYGNLLRSRVEKAVGKREWREDLSQFNEFEATITDAGLVLVKFWLHISKKEQRRRFERLLQSPAERWKVTRDDWRQHHDYEKYCEAVEDMLERTETPQGPWTIVEAVDRRFATAKVFETLAARWEEAVTRKKAGKDPKEKRAAPAAQEKTRRPGVLQRVDLTKKLSEKAYAAALAPLQKKLRELEHEVYVHRIPVTVVCEGWDAAGKGGAIRRLTEKLDPRGFQVIGISAPNDAERAHHYLWRFWREVPKAGHLALFDRSWYGRVLVERVEGFCGEEEWRRSYRELNEFERQLTHGGGVVVKLWFHIDKDEQLARFKERDRVGYKKWKITGEDWRNREKWPLYEEAVGEMIERTSTSYAPWKVIAANDKRHARIEVLQAVVEAIAGALPDGGKALAVVRKLAASNEETPAKAEDRAKATAAKKRAPRKPRGTTKA